MDLHDLYVSLVLPQVRGACVKRLRGFHDWEDRYRLAESWAWYKLVQWTQKGKPCEVWKVVNAAILLAMAGRPIPGSHQRTQQNGPDAMTQAVTGGDMSGLADRRANWEHAAHVAEEYRNWVKWCLSPKKRRIAKDLASGMTTNDAAAKHGVSAGYISQLRMEFRRSWYAWWNRE